MKYILACIGFVLMIVGLLGFDSDVIISLAIIMLGWILFRPYLKEYKRMEEIRERREKKAQKRPPSLKCQHKNYTFIIQERTQKSMVNSNCKVVLAGEIKDISFSHKMGMENFYKANLIHKRLSGTDDVLPIIFSDYLHNFDVKNGESVRIVGDIRKYQKHIHVFCDEIEVVSGLYYTNDVYITGKIIRKPYPRTTKSGNDICDFLVMVERGFSKTDVIPVIAWGRMCKKISNYPIGTEISVWGRLQSRSYTKRNDSGIPETRMVYEVSMISDKFEKGSE